METKKKLNDNAQWFNADCIEVMQYMKENNIQVDLTVTSPPYDSIRTYNNTLEWNFDKFKEIAKLLYDVTSDRGVVVWVVGDQVGFNVNIGKHSAVFPIKLAEDHILSWSNEGDIVFDPFLGSGTTMFAAIKNNRRFIGCEINEDYVKSYEDNYKQYLKRWQNDINRKNKEAVSEKEENN